MRTTSKWLTAALALAISSQAAGPALAQSIPTTVEIRVSSAGLDLKTPAGADEFYKRLSRAASRACGGHPDAAPLILDARGRYETCRAKAMEAAVQQVNSAILRSRFAASPEAAYLKLAGN